MTVPGITFAMLKQTSCVPKMASVRLIAPSPLDVSAFSAATANPSVDKSTPSSNVTPSKVRKTMPFVSLPKSHTIMKSPACRLAHGLQFSISAISSALAGSI